MIQVWTQKCAVKRQVWMSIFHIINFKKKIRVHRGPGFFNKKLILDYPGLLFLLKVRSCVFISNVHHSFKSVIQSGRSLFLFKIKRHR